ncbi:MAG: DUF3943 domain-containing protein [Gammaproteobacteria bacterium]|nr:DUF3943 domain-containing protein [Gammaproteobacteria bacterium]
MIRAIALVNFLLLPVAAWGEVEGDFSPPPFQWLNAERIDNFDLLASAEGVSASGDSLDLSLPLAKPSASLNVLSSPDWDGLKKDTAYFLGYQLSIIGVLYVMPASISGWTDETKDDFSIQQYKDNVSRIVWDKDDWWLNYVLHPYWGGTYYVRAQERGFGPVGSFWYAATLSSLYEFGAEAFFEEPSIQDLIVTPVAGYFVGKYFMEVRADIQKRSTGQLTGTDKFIMVMTDPIGSMNKKVESWFGGNASVSLRPMLGPQFQTAIVNETRFGENNQRRYIGSSDFGLKMSMRW